MELTLLLPKKVVALYLIFNELTYASTFILSISMLYLKICYILSFICWYFISINYCFCIACIVVKAKYWWKPKNASMKDWKKGDIRTAIESHKPHDARSVL